MTVFLVLGGLGVLLLVATLLLDDYIDGITDVLGGGDWFTGMAVAGFLGALGFVGALVLGVTDNSTLGWVSGIVAGLALGALVGWITARLRGSGAGSVPVAGQLVGITAVVATPIPAGGFGSVRLRHGGHLTTLNARCDVPVDAGETVWVVESISPSAVLVRPTHPDEQG